MSNCFQILFDTTSPINTSFAVPISGRRKFQLVGVSFLFNPIPSYMLIQLQSPQLVMHWGNVNGGVYIAYPNEFNHQSFKSKYTFEADINGVFNLNIIDVSTGLLPVNLGLCVLTFELLE